MLIIAFDFGTTSIGIAIGQYLTRTAQPIKAISAKNGIPNWNTLDKVMQEWNPNSAVIGLPLNIDGTKQNITYQSEKFSNRINNRYKITVYLHDERLSTIEAKNLIFINKGFKFLKKKIIDSQSAVIILESWFSHNKF